MTPDSNANPPSDSDPGLLDGLDPKDLVACGLDSLGERETGVHAQVPTVEELNGMLPGLEVLGLIGRGGMGVVYKARQVELDREVALKLLPDSAAASPEFVLRFRREAQAMARLKHPNVVDIFDFGRVESGMLYIVMEYVAGSNLQDVIQSKSLSPRNALAIVSQICDALQYAHDQGVVHRDIKPANILLSEQGQIKVSDFGLAKLRETAGQPEPSLTMTAQIVGTPSYMAPEQLDGRGQIDHRADIYSLGVMFYEMLTGELPRGAFRPPSDVNREVDHRLDKVVTRTLQTEPGQRYQQASEVKTDVQGVASKERARVRPVRKLSWIGAVVGLAVAAWLGRWGIDLDRGNGSGSSNQPDSPARLPRQAPVPPPIAKGPMRELFRCSLDGEDAIRNPERGSGGQLIGQSGFVPGKVGQGRMFTSKGGDRLVFPTISDGTPNISLEKGEVEFWYRPDFDYGDGSKYGASSLFVLGDGYDVPRIQLVHSDFLQLTHTYAGDDGEWSDVCAASALEAALWKAGEWVHFRVFWDSSHPTDSLRLFVNEQDVTDNKVPGGWRMSDYDAVRVFSIGSTGKGSGEQSAHGAFDELIVRGPARSP